MHGLFLSLPHRSPILLLGLLVLSTHSLWAQAPLPLEKIPPRLPDTPAPFASVSEVQILLHLPYRRLPLTFERNQGQTESRMKFFPHYPDDYRLPINTDTAPYPPAKTGELLVKEKDLIGSAPSKWLTFVPTYGNVPHETTFGIENLDHFGHRIPWVGFIILRIAQQAKAHPHVTRLLMVLKPRL
jgi:hypothetical protein